MFKELKIRQQNLKFRYILLPVKAKSTYIPVTTGWKLVLKILYENWKSRQDLGKWRQAGVK